MTQAELKVSIQSDISQLERDLTTAEKLLVQHQQNYESVSRSISQTASRMREVGREAQNLRSAFNSGKISADRFEKEMGQLNKEVRQLDNEMADLTREQTRLGREMQRTTRVVQQQRGGFAGVADGTQQASQGMRQMARTATVNAVPAMTSVSQIVQDMPYGIHGVANNIQQLTMQMGWLTTQAGGTRKALTALMGSLAGPAGLLLAVSAVTSLMVSAEASGRTLGDTLLDLAQRGDVAAKTLREISSSIRETIGQAQQEITTTQTLLGIIRDENAARDQRVDAIRRVNAAFPTLFENLSNEQILAGEARVAIDALSDALIRQAKIKGVQDALTKVYSDIAELTDRLNEGALSWVSFTDVLGAMADPNLGLSSLPIRSLQRMGGEMDENREKAERLEKQLQGLFEESTAAGDYGVLNITPVLSEDKLLDQLDIDPEQLQMELDLENMIVDVEAFAQQVEENARKINRVLNDAFTLYNTTNIEDAIGLASFNRNLELAEMNFYGFEEAVDDTSKEVGKSADRMRRALEMAIQGMIKSMLDGKFEAEDFAKSIIASFLSIGVNNLIGGLPFLSGIFGGGAQAANFRMPSINTAQTASNLNSGAQLSVGVPDIRIQGQDLLVVFDRAQQRKNRIT